MDYDVIPTLPTERLSKSLSFPPSLPLEVALNEIARSGGAQIYEDSELAKEFDLSLKQFETLNQTPQFRAQVLEHKANLKSDLSSVKKKCGLILESYLHDLVPMTLSDPTVSITEKTKLLTLLAEISGAKNNKSDTVAVAEAMAKNSNEPKIVLNFPAGFSPSGMVPVIEAK